MTMPHFNPSHQTREVEPPKALTELPAQDFTQWMTPWVCPCGLKIANVYTRPYNEILGDNEWRCERWHAWTRVQLSWAEFTWRRRTDIPADSNDDIRLHGLYSEQDEKLARLEHEVA